MEIISDNMNFELDSRDNAITVGKFDGIHLGHRKIMRKLIETAKALGGKSIVVTFDVSPYKRLKRDAISSIYTREERIAVLSDLGVDYLVEYPFTDEIMCMSPEIFVEKLLVDHLHAGAIVVGNDFRFGYQRKGDIDILKQLGSKYLFSVDALEKETYESGVISSTVIRDALKTGDIILANRLLGKRFFVSGEVVYGKQLGRTLGMPTINQVPDTDKLLPPFGVYATSTSVDDIVYRSVTNIGIRPTVSSEKSITVETNLLGFTGNLYGRQMVVEFLDYLRPEKKFTDIRSLAEQMHEDKEQAKQWKEQAL